MSNVVKFEMGKVETMSHVEIANLTGKRNDNVKRTMQTLENKGIITVTHFEEQQILPTGGLGKNITTYNVNERDSYIVVAQLSPEFTAKLVDFWMDKRKPETVKLPQTYIEALEALVASEKQKEAALLQIQEDAPKVEYHDRIVDAVNLKSWNEVAKSLGIGRNKMLKFLRNQKVLNISNTPYQSYMDSAYFEVKTRATQLGYSTSTTYVTGKGETWLFKYLKKHNQI